MSNWYQEGHPSQIYLMLQRSSTLYVGISEFLNEGVPDVKRSLFFPVLLTVYHCFQM